jgi:hypothetical protein
VELNHRGLANEAWLGAVQSRSEMELRAES